MENQETKNIQQKSETELFFESLNEFLRNAPVEMSYVIMAKGAYNNEHQANGILAVKASKEEISSMVSNSISQAPDGFGISLELGLERSKKEFNPIKEFLKYISNSKFEDLGENNKR